ncbi:mandelate racemase/muconate lactonizing enzyme family protein [Roseomonas alkaliterrae]|uniref:L-alanine-DL-glutamate epimerase-like enolase superfamily enzyme n=1 Tax=Neoroseomonas alkaliterrae TaxID=1452450 RepID=A0A840Y2I1_9PROT|nr:mandelate racemase/muconate lactonizing enzyme family protein [Neoroseomonas alkaliterrae]MBB5688084.1 L-alanine-DL-glutamate epimerase-like enolase superfamily enzyme [Neoroseomonas alkaliterrae]MBR0674956.1 mandelate racemase/muconate lactonizing enzyme family protein [Neoroseomonas alkaliterrae]
MRIRSVEAVIEQLAGVEGARGYSGLNAAAFVRCRIVTEDGLVGSGVTGRFLAGQVAALLGGAMAEAVAGRDARDIEALRRDLAERFAPRGGVGVFTAALSALDMALWDLRARAAGEPLWRLLGGARQVVPCYATVGLPGYDEARLVEACRSAVAAGFRGVKMLVAAGGRGVEEDAARVRAVRAAIGPAAWLMLDANCGMTVADAKRLALLVEECDIAWFEEPVLDNDIAALAMLRRSIRIPLAAGQMMQSPAWFRDALVQGAVDWLQCNAAFCGGISAMMRILAMAEAHGVPVSHAGGWDIANAAMMAGHAHGGLLEMHGAQLALRARLAEDMVPEGGAMALPDRPGIGFAFRES